MAFYEQLIYLRKQRGLSQEQLGNQIGVSRQTVSKWELGDTTPELEKLIQLSEFFGITIDALVDREKEGGANQGDVFGQPAAGAFRLYRWHYEYKSKRMLFGVPLVHVNIGQGLYKAKGIIAIGTVAKGIISIGAVTAGILSMGAVSAGILSLGALSLGLLASVGAISVGTIAVGGLAVGIFAIGGCAFGLYSIGGCAIAAKVAGGGYANAPIAIGDQTSGQLTFDIHQPIAKDAIRGAILQKFPGTWRVIADLFNSFS